MSDERSLYEKVILDHNKNPRNFCAMTDASCSADGRNPLCGDLFTVYLKMDGDKIESVSFEGCGCAISKSSGSVMTTVLQGKTRIEAEELFNRFHNMLTAEPDEQLDLEPLGKLAVFCGVRNYPIRVKCATVAWHALLAALEDARKPVSGE